MRVEEEGGRVSSSLRRSRRGNREVASVAAALGREEEELPNQPFECSSVFSTKNGITILKCIEQYEHTTQPEFVANFDR